MYITTMHLLSQTVTPSREFTKCYPRTRIKNSTGRGYSLVKKGIQLTEDDSRFIDQVVGKAPVTARPQTRETMEELLRLLVPAERFAEEFFPPDLWDSYSDDELTALMDLPPDSSEAVRQLADQVVDELEGKFVVWRRAL